MKKIFIYLIITLSFLNFATSDDSVEEYLANQRLQLDASISQKAADQ